MPSDVGPALPRPRSDYIMVTMPSEAAAQYGLVLELVRAGMNVCTSTSPHDDSPAWQAMIGNLAREKELGRKCQVLMDLAGNKLRTGPRKKGQPNGSLEATARLPRKYPDAGPVFICPASLETSPIESADAVLRVVTNSCGKLASTTVSTSVTAGAAVATQGRELLRRRVPGGVRSDGVCRLRDPHQISGEHGDGSERPRL